MFDKKWQKFYTLMDSNDFDNFGIDIQYTLNNSILQNDFERVLKMDCGSGYEKYMKIYINEKWKFQFIAYRMASPIRYEVKITDQLSSEVYDFSNPNDNKYVLNKWLDYFFDCCKNDGIVLRQRQLNNNGYDLTINHGVLDLSKKQLGDLSILKDVNNPLECKKLKLDETQISEIKNLDRFKNLEILNLGNNFITKIYGLQDLKKLKELSLYTNQIRNIENLDSLKNLKELNLDCNQITEIKDLDNLEKLEVLSINNNKITIISNLDSLYSLKNIFLDENPVQEITSIGNLPNLRILRIHNNNLPPNLLNALDMILGDSVVPDIETVKKYARGEFVQVNDEYILAFNSPDIEYGGLSLHLGDRNIDYIKSIQNITKIDGLKALILWNNKIKEIDGLEKLKDLEFLFLNRNDITEIQGLESLKNLKLLKINNNKITKIENLHNLTELRRLELNNNKIKEINGLEFLKNLERLDLSHNKISEICNLDNLEQLTQIFLQNNQINKIKGLKSLKKLEELYLSSNLIKRIEGLESLANIQILNLSKNNIMEIPTLENNKKLIELDLSFNMISKFCSLSHLQHLNRLILEGNDSITELIKKIKKISSDERNFAKNCIGYCLLKGILKRIDINRINFIKFEDLNVYNQFLLRFKYQEIKAITHLLTNQYVEYQVGRNEFVISVFTPSYFANSLAKLLEKIEPGDNYEYEHLKNELSLRNIEVTENLIKFIEKKDAYIKIPFIRKLKSIVRRIQDDDKLILEIEKKIVDLDYLRKQWKDELGYYWERTQREIDEYFEMIKENLSYKAKELREIPREEILREYSLDKRRLKDPLFTPGILKLLEYIKTNNFNLFPENWKSGEYNNKEHASYLWNNVIPRFRQVANKVIDFKISQYDKFYDRLDLGLKKKFITRNFEKFGLKHYYHHLDLINDIAYHNKFFVILPILLRTLFENILHDIFKISLDNRHKLLYFDKKQTRVADFSVLIELLNQLCLYEYKDAIRSNINEKIIEILNKVKLKGNLTVHELTRKILKTYAAGIQDEIDLALEALLISYDQLTKVDKVIISPERLEKIEDKIGLRKQNMTKKVERKRSSFNRKLKSK